MKEQFEGSLNSATAEKHKAEAQLQPTKMAKNEVIAASTNKVTNKETEAGNAAERNAAVKQDLGDPFAADTEFLANLKTECAALDKEYAERTKTQN